MAENQGTSETFVIDDFPGYFQGVSKSKLPPGALIDLGSIKVSNRSDRVRVSNSGELLTCGNYSRMSIRSGILSWNAWKAMGLGLYHWSPPRGGDQLVIANTDCLYRLAMDAGTGTDPNLIFLLNYVNDLSTLGTDENIVYTNPNSFASFAPFNESLYYTSGTPVPYRISNILSQKREAMGAGTPLNLDTCFGAGVGGSYWDQPVVCRGKAPSDMSAGSTYYLTFVTRFGESPLWDRRITCPTQLYWDVYYSYTAIYFTGWASLPGMYKAVNIYRRSNVDGTLRFLVSLPKGETTFVDTVSETDLLYRLPISPLLGNPPMARLLCGFGDRMFGVGGYGNHNRLACSRSGFPDMWPPQYELTGFSYNSAGDYVTQVKEINSSLYLFLKHRIVRMYGSSPENYGFEIVSNYIGCIAPKTMFPWQDGYVFLSSSGLYYFDGTTPKRLTDPVQGIFNRTSVGSMGLETACGAVAGDTYYLSYRDDDEYVTPTTDGPDLANRVLSCNLYNGKWGVRNDLCTFTHSTQFSGNRAIVMGGCNPETAYPNQTTSIGMLSDYGAIDANTDTDKANPAIFLADLDLGYPTQNKVLESIEFWYEAIDAADATITVYRSYPNDDVGTTSEAVQVVAVHKTAAEIALWGVTWPNGVRYGDTSVRYIKASFSAMSGKSFGVALLFTSLAPEVRIQKCVIRFHLENTEWEPY
jgi:hypothetical protein